MKFLCFFILNCLATLSFATEIKSSVDEVKVEDSSFIDETYDSLHSTFDKPSIWFDNFFQNEQIIYEEDAGTMVRITNSFTWNEDSIESKARISARLYLPKLSKRLKLILESENEGEDDLIRDYFPSDNKDGKTTLALNYNWITKPNSSFNIKVNARPGISARYYYEHPFTESITGSLTQKIYQQKKVTGSNTEFDLKFSLTRDRLLRFTNSVAINSDDEGATLHSSLNLYQFISPKKAINYSTGMIVQNKPSTHIERHYISMNYRQNFVKDWFFIELSPSVNWSDGQKGNASLVLTLEVLFDHI